MCRIYFQTAVRDLNMLSMEKRSGPIYEASREDGSRDTEPIICRLYLSHPAAKNVFFFINSLCIRRCILYIQIT